jgi:class 3 adenylate cyclase
MDFSNKDTQSIELRGERRQLTALFYDIVGSTTLLHQLDPEDFQLLQNVIHTNASRIISRHGGIIDQMRGDGGVAYFGLPLPDEDAAESAILAALEIIERGRISGEAADDHIEIRIRAGIATGLVVVGQNADSRYDFVGLTPALAERIQAIAVPNTVAVSDPTYRLTRGIFQFQPLGEAELKGFNQPQTLWRPLQQRPLADRFSKLRRPYGRFVGREDDLKAIVARWNHAQKGQGQVVELVGDAGIGKSRLTLELRRILGEEEARVHIFQCQPRGNSRPLHPFVDALRPKTRRRGANGTEVTPSDASEAATLDRLVADCSPDARQVLTFLLGEGRLDGAGAAQLSGISHEQFVEKAMAAVLEVLTGWCRKRPQIFIIEDLHWADTLTLSLLERLVADVRRMPILILLTSRHGILTTDPEPHVQRRTLSRLTSAEISSIVASMLKPLPVPSGFVSFVEEKSDGVPLYVEELVTFFRERLENSGELSWAAQLADAAIVTLEDLLAARLVSLGAARNLAQLAAVLGRDFSEDLLSRLTKLAMPTAVFRRDFSDLVAAGIIEQVDRSNSSRFRFRHVLLQEAAYNGLLKSRRRQLHKQVVDLVLANSELELPDEVMAWHCEQARYNRLAVEYAIRAGEACSVRSSVREADDLFNLAKRHLAALDASSDSSDMMLRLLSAHGPVAVALYGKGSPQARDTYEQGITICRDREVSDRDQWFPLYWGWWFTSPDNRTKRRRAQVIMSDLAASRSAEIRLQAFHCAWASNFHIANYNLCLKAIDDGLKLYDPDVARVSRTKYGDHDAKVCGCAERALALWLQGHEKAADESLDEALAWAHSIDHLGSQTHALDVAMTLRSYEQRVEDVLMFADRARVIADSNSLPVLVAKSRIFSGWAMAVSGKFERGFSEFEGGLATQRSIGSDEDLPFYLGMLSQMYEKRGELEKAHKTLDEAIREARGAANLFWLPELMRRRGVIGLRIGADPALSRADLIQAIALAEHQGAHALADTAGESLRKIEGDK